MRSLRFVLAVLMLSGLAVGTGLAVEPAAPVTEEEKTAYALGAMLARNLAGFELTPAEVAQVQKAIADAAAGRESAVNLEEYEAKVRALAQERGAKRAEREKEKGKAFAAAEGRKPGATTTPSGLIFRETKAGTGASPAATDKVKVHYRGAFIDGKEFDSSKPEDPVQFGLSQVIPCWTEGVQKMKIGGKANLVCPSDIAYGDRGRPGIPPGATLVFDIELLEIVK